MKTNSAGRPLSVLVPDGESNYAISVVRCLAEVNNINTIVLSKNWKSGTRFSRYTSKFIYDWGGNTKEERLNKIIHYIKETNPDILLPVDIECIRLIAENKEKVANLTAIAPIPEVGSFDIADDKWRLSVWLKENNIPHPETVLFTPAMDLDEVTSLITFPIIIKPRRGSGGKGIYIIKTPEELQSWHSDFNHSEDLIIQSYINGYDIDCSIVCSEGKVLTHTVQKSLKYETDYPWPYGIEFLENEEIFNIAQEVAKKFHWEGVVHIDLRYDEVEQRAKLIEMNPRFWASVTASLFAGVNFPYLSVLSGLGKEIPTVKNQNKRVLRSGPAMKMFLTGLFNKRKDLSYDNSFLEFIVKDPLPNLFSESFEIYNRYKKH